MENEWTRVDRMAEALEDHFGRAPGVLVVLGSGLGQMAEELDDRQSLETTALTDWPKSTVEGHAGFVHKGTIGKVSVLVFQGRVHRYEGYSPAEVVRSIRSAITWGVKTVVLTNAAGGIAPALAPGQLMILEDHLNLSGSNPLAGLPPDNRGDRFPDMSNLYTKALIALAERCADSQGSPLQKGVYAGLLGPSYETPAEIRMLSNLGASAVGMSTVLEAIAAGHLGAQVLGLSCITNKAAGLADALLDHTDVQKIANQAQGDLTALLTAFVTALGGTDP
jgi:purine-nucleoside phosphorylase